MIFVVLVVLCVITVPLAGGRLSHLSELRLRGVSLAAGGLILQIVIINILPGGSPTLHGALQIVSYVIAAGFLVVNRRIPGLWLVGLGGGMNVLAITANGGVMPASPSALASAGLIHHAGQFTNSAPVTHAHLAWLGDVFAWPSSMPLPNVFSIGDVVIVLGLLILVHRAGRSRIALAAHRLIGARTDKRAAVLFATEASELDLNAHGAS